MLIKHKLNKLGIRSNYIIKHLTARFDFKIANNSNQNMHAKRKGEEGNFNN